MDFYILCLIAFLGFANLVLLFFLGVFVVRSHDRTISIIGNLIDVLLSQTGDDATTSVALKPRTWDEKYEAELEAIAQRMRQSSGLTDL
jgi:hypothetical protein